MKPKVGQEVFWESPFDGWRSGFYLGPAPLWNNKSEFASVRSHNGVVHVRFDVLSFHTIGNRNDKPTVQPHQRTT